MRDEVTQESRELAGFTYVIREPGTGIAGQRESPGQNPPYSPREARAGNARTSEVGSNEDRSRNARTNEARAGTNRKPPALVLLHGTGGDEYDLLDLGGFVAPGSTLVSPRGRAPEGALNRWFARHAEGVLDQEDIRRRAGELADFLVQLREVHGIEPGSLFALGFSNGANMAAAMLLLYPGLLAGAVLLRPMLPLEPETRPDLGGKPVYIAAGTRDTMIPPESTRSLIARLEEAGADLQVRWAEAGHRFSMTEVGQAGAWFRSLGAGE
ncbi:alpha/beta hydrolase [Spirochaeta lutea]|uniref:alpha/beta hydrolase n=1 Tax=Spirochaeta lutea TaxID=1480694 RepID=UPI0009E09215|nr:alpha/beta hydrolase [Spirochaeta lutea]